MFLPFILPQNLCLPSWSNCTQSSLLRSIPLLVLHESKTAGPSRFFPNSQTGVFQKHVPVPLRNWGYELVLEGLRKEASEVLCLASLETIQAQNLRLCTPAALLGKDFLEMDLAKVCLMEMVKTIGFFQIAHSLRSYTQMHKRIPTSDQANRRRKPLNRPWKLRAEKDRGIRKKQVMMKGKTLRSRDPVKLLHFCRRTNSTTRYETLYLLPVGVSLILWPAFAKNGLPIYHRPCI